VSLSIFGEKDVMPNEKTLTEVLSDSKILWDNLQKHVATVCGNMKGQWKFYSKKASWSFVVKSGDRTILYLIPQNAFFKVNFVLGNKAVVAACTNGLPEQIITLITEATPYMEGRSFMFDVKTATDVDAAKKLIKIKYTK
jgi:hypothetical protein